MRYRKMLGLLAVAAGMMAFSGTASAKITSPFNTPNGAVLAATSTNLQIDGTVDITCSHSAFEAKPTSVGSTTLAVYAYNTSGCSRSVTATALGHYTIHSDGDVTWVGFRQTVQATVLGFPVHCIYATNNTQVGTLTEGVAPAKIHIWSAPIPQEATSSLCGDDALLTGTYTVTRPATAITVH